MVDTGNKVQLKTISLRQQLEKLLKVSSKNIRLLHEAVFFEVCI